jgi:6-phosphogluconolactonase (cycloisomerase 2 family)
MKPISFVLFLALSLGNSAHRPGSKLPANPPAGTSYLITNDDLPPKVPTSATFFTIGPGGRLLNPNIVSLGGVGAGGGYFAANRVNVLNNAGYACGYLSLGGSSEISAVNIQTQQVVGNFLASQTDSGFDNGIGLTNNGTYLYGAFSTSATIATFAVMPGCGLQFLGSISAVGLQGGGVKGIAAHGNLLVAAYADGSIESFNLSAGIPVSNGDLQNAKGFAIDNYPDGVDITQDGRYAIFGDMSTTTIVEVSDLSSGRLTKTVLYRLGTAGNSNSVFLSPDETLLYIANNSSGQVTAAFFDKTTGKVSRGCTTPALKGFDVNWVWLSSPATESTSGTGSPLYLAEYGTQSGIAVIDVTAGGGKCTLTETSDSPVQAPNTTTLLSIGVYPPRPF